MKRALGTALVLGALLLPAAFALDEGPLAAGLREVIELRDHGKLEAARVRAEELRADFPDDLTLHALWQDFRRALGEERAVAAEYLRRSKASEAGPDDLFLYGRLLEPHRALNELKKALRKDPQHYHSLCAAAAMLLELDRPDEALRMLATARDARPDAALPLALMGWAAELTPDPVLAESRYREALEKEPGTLLALDNLGFLLAGLGRAEEAGQVFDRAQRMAPADPLPLVGLGLLREEAGETEEAVELYTKAVELPTNTWLSLSVLGKTLLALGNPANARKCFERAHELAAENPGVLVNLGYSYLAEGKAKLATEWIRKALSLDKDDPEATFFLGLCQERDGRTKDAVACYKRAMSLVPEEPDYPRALAALYGRQGRFKDAIANYMLVVDLTEGSAESLVDLACAYVGFGDMKKAVNCFEEALAADPENLDALMNLGLVLKEKLVDEPRAIEMFRAYLDAGGKDKRVKDWLAELTRK